jgi:hypothetical protein
VAECHFKGCESAGQLLECVAIVEEEVVGLWRAEGRMLTRVEARERNATFYKIHLQHLSVSAKISRKVRRYLETLTYRKVYLERKRRAPRTPLPPDFLLMLTAVTQPTTPLNSVAANPSSAS